MLESISKYLINKLIDWLIALGVASIFMWFIFTQPIINWSYKASEQVVDTNKLKEHVQLLTEGYAPRTVNYDNLNDTADYIYREFSSVGIPEYQIIKTISHQYRNVILQLGPDTQELYVIGAHYDAKDDSIDSEGNASGVATLIELARILALNNHKLDIGVVLVAYPLSLNQSDYIVNTGSYFHAKSLQKNDKKVRLMISLDSVGQSTVDSKNKNPPYGFRDLLYPSKDNSINLVGRLKDFNSIRTLKKGFNNTSNLSLHSQNLLENFNKTHSSDHINYWRQGYPAVLISDISAINKNSMDELRIEPKERLDYEKMASLVNGLYQVIIETRSNEDASTQLVQRSRNRKKHIH